MNWHRIGLDLFIFFLSSLKLGFGGVPAAVVAKFPFFKAITITTAGGVTGAWVFANISQWALDKWHRLRLKYFPIKKDRLTQPHENRFIAKIKTKWGLAGIAFFTPFILSIPIGTALAVHFYRDKQKVISYMFISIVAWDFIFYFFYLKFYFIILSYFHFHHW
ncbi:MAG: hypothetical protein HKL88_07870 [Bacteroidia bacterium]|jgi:hypothetical protein|nr:hypothetical protein [Bacteroidia bacterium]